MENIIIPLPWVIFLCMAFLNAFLWWGVFKSNKRKRLNLIEVFTEECFTHLSELNLATKITTNQREELERFVNNTVTNRHNDYLIRIFPLTLEELADCTNKITDKLIKEEFVEI